MTSAAQTLCAPARTRPSGKILEKILAWLGVLGLAYLLACPCASHAASALPMATITIAIEESYSLYGPAGMPKTRTRELEKLAREALDQPNVKARFHAMGLEPAPTTPEEQKQLIENLYQRWGEIVKTTGFQPTQ